MLLYLVIAILILFLFNNLIEYFDIGSDNEYTSNEAVYKSDADNSKPTFSNPIDYQPKNKLNCCLVEKKYIEDNKNTPIKLRNSTGGHFKYVYTKLEDEKCDLKLFRLDNNKQLFFDGVNNWSNNYCKVNNSKNVLGSCRLNSKECIDFVDKNYCDKYKMTWSEKTCHDPLDFVWKDPIKLNKSTDDGTFKMF
jgi:hypothetical protein